MIRMAFIGFVSPTLYNVKNTFVLSLSTSVDSCVPGDVVTISGMVKVNSVDEGILQFTV